MNAILVKNVDGHYEINTAAEMEDWDEVQSRADWTEKVEDLCGWMGYKQVYKVQVDGHVMTYFVD